MLILASQSPRRKEILEMLGYSFLCKPADADETIPDGIAPDDAVILLARRKAETIALDDGDIAIGSDTVVVLDGKILGKPENEACAADMLRALSGRTHTVFTGVCIRAKNQEEFFCSATDVTFYDLTNQEISDYIKTGDPMDKAGAYGIQSVGAVNIRKIDGDFFTVMGLPAAKTARMLRNFGIYPCNTKK